MPQYALLSPEQHNELKIQPKCNFSYAAKQHQAPLTANEFGFAASSFPVVFMKDPVQGQFRPVVLFALVAGHNLFVKDNEWLGTFVPSAMLRQPFELGPDPQQEKSLTLYIDEKSGYVSDTQGEPLYEQGQPTQYLLQVQKNIADYYQNELDTHDFTQHLLHYALLREMELLIDFNDDTKTRVKGLYTIDEEKLGKLPDTDVLALNRKNYLVPIHAMLTSIHQLNRLITLHNSCLQPTVRGVQMRTVTEEL